MAQEDLILMSDDLVELNLPVQEIRLFVMRLDKEIGKAVISLLRTRHQIEIF